MKKKYLLLIALFVSVLVVTGCGKKENELIGTWSGHSNEVSEEYQMEATFIFESEGKVTYKNSYGTNTTGTYKIKDNIVTIEVSAWDKAKEYKFKIDGDKLDLIAQDDYSPSYEGLEKE